MLKKEVISVQSVLEENTNLVKEMIKRTDAICGEVQNTINTVGTEFYEWDEYQSDCPHRDKEKDYCNNRNCFGCDEARCGLYSTYVKNWWRKQ